MVGSVKEFTVLVKKKNNSVVITNHCFLHVGAMVAKTLGATLQEIFDSVVEMVNYIKRRPLKSRLFQQIRIDMDTDYKNVLLHAEIR